jgi:hypothetical protein
MASIHSFRETGERYPFLRILASICHVVGILVLTLAVLLFVAGVGSYLLNTVPPYGGWGVGIAVIWSAGLFVSGIQFFAMGSFLRLAIHVEENTRATAQALDRLRSSVELKPEVDAHSIFLS